MKLKPMHDWAVIMPSEAEARTAGGLYIPDTAKEKPEEGVVESIGPGAFEEEKRGKKKEEKKERKFVPTTVKPGDRVLYERYAGQNYKIGEEDRILVRERDILGWIERPRVTTAVMTRPVSPLMNVPGSKTSGKPPKAKAKKAAAKASAKKGSTKKAGKKTAKKTARKAVKKTAAKSRKTAKPKGRKTGKKK